ncbi:exopolysaccharide biosynthesis polyprenyl glycosylphosphotransferase [Caulobacter sp. NIBR2454]|uniref:exopolysaccharide biosynthesis polyprenyl glycosylphosphotransferase n=1 Tax=Caulobacter sp. NIBR2454 TaxID=3015996 RepID=UPI0022B70C75|nr:exopolysaccharide biosynthesis polyprenyl glycosylphosphotransferase [Caulobacter sp. NIBR2454]
MYRTETAEQMLTLPSASKASCSAAKRALDILVSGLIILFILPLLAAIAIAVKMSSPGPILFRQKRNGMGCEHFTILKFRSMTVENQDHFRQATKDDCRVTPVGRFLRKTSLDELPQLFNILRGDMSLVGPRPHALAHDDQCRGKITDYDQRYAIRPGLTGLAQVSGYRGETNGMELMAERVRLDLVYIDTWSFGADLAILAKTALVVFFQKEAY